MAVNLAGGGGGDLKQLMAEHQLGVKEDTSNSGISLDIVYLKQAEHLMRSDNYKSAIKYTHKALEINPELTVSKNFQPTVISQQLLIASVWFSTRLYCQTRGFELYSQLKLKLKNDLNLR